MRLPFCLKRDSKISITIILHVRRRIYGQISLCINILCISIVITQEIIAFSYRYSDWISCFRSVCRFASKRYCTTSIRIPAGIIFLVNSRGSRLASSGITMVIIQSQRKFFRFPYSIKGSMVRIIIIGTISFCVPI